MKNVLFDLLPVLAFFIVFKFYGIYAATWVGIVTTVLQTTLYRLFYKKWDKMQVITLSVFLIFGGMTLYFHNPIFVKWKPTIVFWTFATILFLSHFIGNKPLVQRILESALAKNNPSAVIVLPDHVGKKLNLAWALFFAVLGTVNLYIAYTFNDNVWVNFKLYGITGSTFLFSILQTLFLMRHLEEKPGKIISK